MKVKNLTSKIQALKVIDLTGGREFTIYIKERSCSDITGMYIADKSQLAHKFEIISDDNISSQEIEPEDSLSEVLPLEDSEESSDVEDNVVEEDNDKEEIKDSIPESLSSKFLCDICGAEFASDRGLSSHKSRAHK